MIASTNQQPNTNPRASPSQNHRFAHTATLPNNPPPNCHCLNSLIKKSQAQQTEEHPFSVITNAKSADRPRSAGHFYHFNPQSVTPYTLIKVTHK